MISQQPRQVFNAMGELPQLVEDGALASNHARERLGAISLPPEAGTFEIAAGNEKLLNFLTGQLMKAATTKPNPKMATDVLRKKILG